MSEFNFSCIAKYDCYDGWHVESWEFDHEQVKPELSVSHYDGWIQDGVHDQLSLHWTDEVPGAGKYKFNFTVVSGYDYYGEYDECWYADFEVIYLAGWEGRWQRVINKNLNRRRRREKTHT